MKITKYGLREIKSGKILGYHETERISIYSDKMWLVDSDINAEYVRNFSTIQSYSCYKTPQHEFKPDELEVVKIIIEQSEEKVDVKIPTIEEFFKEKYPNDYRVILRNLKRNKYLQYSLYDLEELLKTNK